MLEPIVNSIVYHNKLWSPCEASSSWPRVNNVNVHECLSGLPFQSKGRLSQILCWCEDCCGIEYSNSWSITNPNLACVPNSRHLILQLGPPVLKHVQWKRRRISQLSYDHLLVTASNFVLAISYLDWGAFSWAWSFWICMYGVCHHCVM